MYGLLKGLLVTAFADDSSELRGLLVEHNNRHYHIYYCFRDLCETF